jgi:hypothetical protein
VDEGARRTIRPVIHEARGDDTTLAAEASGIA